VPIYRDSGGPGFMLRAGFLGYQPEWCANLSLMSQAQCSRANNTHLKVVILMEDCGWLRPCNLDEGVFFGGFVAAYSA
jgi:hypothetical protein